MKNRSALILASPLSKQHLTSKFDSYIPLTLLAYRELEKNNLPVSPIEQFYSRNDHNIKIDLFNSDLKELLELLDKNAEELNLGRNRYSLNGFWFFHRLQDLFYIKNLSLSFLSQFDEITLHSFFNKKKVHKINVSWDSLRFESFGGGTEHVVQWIDYFLSKENIKYSFFSVEDQYRRTKKLGSPLLNLIFRLPKILSSRSQKAFNHFSNNLESKDHIVWKIQEGYEVKVLEEELSHVNFKAPHFITPETQNVASFESSLVPHFLDKHFPECKKLLMSFFEDYQSNIVSSAPNAKKYINDQIFKEKPRALLYSSGSSTLKEALYAEAANDNKVHVAFFKHSGIENIFLKESYLDLYFEKSRFIPRIQFIHSPIELNHLKASDSIQATSIFPLENKYYPSSPQGVLYSMGPSATWSLKDIHKITLNSEKYSFIKSTLKSSQFLRKPMHIKVHPADWSESHYLLSQINHPSFKYKILAGGTIEKIINHYEVIVLDMISTKVLNAALRSQKKIILYKPKGVQVNPDYYKYLEKRVRIVSDYKDIGSAIFEALKEDELSFKNKLRDFDSIFFTKVNRKESFQIIQEKLDINKKASR